MYFVQNALNIKYKQRDRQTQMDNVVLKGSFLNSF